MTAPPERDPLAGSDSRPSVATKNHPIGTVFGMIVQEYPQLVQGFKVGTRTRDTWDDGSPRMSVVIAVQMITPPDLAGQELGLWAGKPSDLQAKLSDAQEAAGGGRIAPGFKIWMKVVSEEQTDKPSPKKIHAVKVEPGTLAPDPFGATPSPAPPQQPPAQVPPIQQMIPPQQPAQPLPPAPPPSPPVYPAGVQPVAAPQPTQTVWTPPPVADPFGAPQPAAPSGVPSF